MLELIKEDFIGLENEWRSKVNSIGLKMVT